MNHGPVAAEGKRIVTVENLTRVEGEGSLDIVLDGNRIEDVRVNIFEPPRFFEAFLRGRHFDEVPDITARICGICPAAHQMSAVHALEAALGVDPPTEIRSLRRLLYCAEYIESHALHIFMLQAPDFLGYDSAISLARDQPDLVAMGLRIKKAGNTLLEILGGRASHPVSVCVGGFHRVPRRRELLAAIDELAWAVAAARDTVWAVSHFDFPDFEADHHFVALSHPDEYPLNEGRIVSSRGLDLEATGFEQTFAEEHVPHSTALHSREVRSGESYFVGPMARVNLNRERLLPSARAAADPSGVQWPSRNPFKGIIARAVELVQACEEALAIVSDYVEPPVPRVAVKPRAGSGCAVTEAPRGMLYHRYELDDSGLVTFARIIPPTSQNLGRMEDDLRLFLPSILDHPDEEVAARCEALIRCYDPCISCSTHFIKVRIDRK